MALLRRKVERVVVFINTCVPIETNASKISTRFCGMDPTLMSFFGYGKSCGVVLCCVVFVHWFDLFALV
jgi:hypothetical protein